MTPPDESPPKPTELRPAQVPWGTRKPPAGPPKAEPIPPPVPPPAAPPPPNPAPALSAKKIPWGARKTPPAPAPVSETTAADSTVTHMPWAVTTPPIPPPAAAPTAASIFAKLVPWGARKAPKEKSSPPRKKSEERPTPNAWALPKGAAVPAEDLAAAQAEMEFTREARPADDDEPSAEQLVAYLSKLPSRRKDLEAVASNPMTPYKARPISFEATRWEAFLMWANFYRVRLGIGVTLFVLALSTAYLWKLVRLNTAIEHDWQALDAALRDRYALVPSYLECIETYSDSERYTVAVTQKGLTAWRSARTDREVADAAVQMEHVLKLLSKVMTRFEQEVPVKDPDQADSSAEFARLERQKEKSRRVTGELVQHYDEAVADFNGKLDGAPGSWIAWAAKLHRRVPIFAADN